MAIALTAWLIAPAPMAWTSTRPLLRITPAIAPATATGLEVAETLSTSTGARSADIAGTLQNSFWSAPWIGFSRPGEGLMVNSYELNGPGPEWTKEPVRLPVRKRWDTTALSI